MNVENTIKKTKCVGEKSNQVGEFFLNEFAENSLRNYSSQNSKCFVAAGAVNGVASWGH